MAIDKIKLRGLAKDKDERLFAEGDYLDALNVINSGTGESTESVLKNVKGTTEASGVTLPSGDQRVIGSVGDPVRGYVYFFVHSTDAENHSIYRYKALDHTFELVLRSSVLGFQQSDFVHAELVNGEFERDESTQTIIYFTDNRNPPRKINADRAIGDNVTELYSDDQIFEFLSVAKTPAVFPPTVTMDTDTDKETNNFTNKVFQFATQYVYKDGEETAISPHSTVVHPKYMALQGINSSNVDQDSLREENRALIDTRYTSVQALFQYNRPEVVRMKVLGRIGNTGSWFVIDEFDPSEDLVKADPHNDGATATVYTAGNGVYRFYNDGLYTYLGAEVTDRIYDDVPHKATTQTLVGNRLMYSSPTSGYENIVPSATFTVTYHSEPTVDTYTGDDIFNGSDIFHSTGGYAEDSGFVVLKSNGLPSALNANSTLTLTLDYKPKKFGVFGYYDPNPNEGTDEKADLPLLKINLLDDNGDEVTYYCGEAQGSQTAVVSGDGHVECGIDPEAVQYATLTASITVYEDTSKTDYMNLLLAEVKNQVLNYSFNGSISGAVSFVKWSLRSSGAGGGGISAHLRCKRFDFSLGLEDSYLSNEFGVASASGESITLQFKGGNFFIPQSELGNASNTSGLSGQPGGALTSIDTNLTQQATNLLSGQFVSVEPYYAGLYEPNLLNGIDTNHPDDATQQPRGGTGYLNQGTYDLTNSNAAARNGAKNLLITSLPNSVRRTFKAGCVHDIGVVYFDRHGRPGFVNELGSVYVAPFGDNNFRYDGVSDYYNGPADIVVTPTHDPPDWATSYQFVYPGMGTFSKFETYTVGGGFTLAGSTTDDNIYVSLNTLINFREQKGALKNYTYTPGDKLRIVSYKDDSDGSTLLYTSEERMFDIVGVEEFASSPNFNPPAQQGDIVDNSNFSGTFLKVQELAPATGLDDFDGSNDNLFKNQCLVELLTPRSTVEDKVYYEIGSVHPISTHGDAITLTEGDVHYRAASLLAPVYDDSGLYSASDVGGTPQLDDFVAKDYNNWVYTARNIESMDVSDYVASRVWSKGRAHLTNEKAATINYYNRISYSEETQDDLGEIKYSSFNPDSLSYKDLPKKYGAVNFIGNFNQSIIALQDNKMSIIPVNRGIIEYADGDSNISVNSQVMNQQREANADFGVGPLDICSVLVKDGRVFFADRSRQKIIMALGAEMKAISDLEMSSYFEDQFEALANANGNPNRIISGYDPEEDMYYVTIEPRSHDDDGGSGAAYAGTTVGFDIPNGRWISRYSFLPSNYANIDNKFLSCKHDKVRDGLIHKHTDAATYNTFYGTNYASTLSVLSKISPSEVKVFNALSLEGSDNEWTMTGADTNLGTVTGGTAFIEKEGSFYADFPRSTKSGSDQSYYINIGNLEFVDGSTSPIYTSNLNLSRLPLPLNKNINLLLPLPTGLVEFVQIDAISGNQITFDFAAADPSLADNAADGLQVFIGLDAAINGDSIRGNWCQIDLSLPTGSPSSGGERELYCVNTHIAGSKLHHPKGQQ